MSSRRSPGAPYERSIFINCPFDDTYRPIFNAILFVIQDLGYVARCALESDDSSAARLEKILELIAGCKYGIHDISRAERNSPELPRFNMPLELGLFLGCKRFGVAKHKSKVCLVMDSDKYRYLEFVTDLRGMDIKNHEGEAEKAVQAVRKWLGPAPERTRHHGAARIWERFKSFEAKLPAICRLQNITPDELSFVERQQFAAGFIMELDAKT